MNTKSFLETEKNIKKYITKYKEFEKISKNPYIRFFAKTKDLTISIYTTNKIVIQSKQEIENIKNQNKENTYLQFGLGSDEVGCGDIFGPVVTCCVLINEKTKINELLKLNIKDSKKLKKEEIIKISQTIIKNNLVEFSVYILNNIEYNQLILKLNQNELKMFTHLKTRSKFENNLNWIIDEFSTPKSLNSYQEKLIKMNLINRKFCFFSQTKAEKSYLNVAIASILARYYFLRKIYVLNQELNQNLKLGASLEAKKQFKFLKKEHNMKKYAKLNFKI